MPVRPQAIDNDAAAFAEIMRRLRSVEDAQRSRLLPPGYSYKTVEGDLVITRKSDGATTTLVFA